MSGAHAVLAPSSASRWVRCAGSVLLGAMYPETREEQHAALEGEATHWGGAELLCGREIDVGQVTPNGIVLNEEMIDGAEMYAETIDARLAFFGMGRDNLHVEEPVSITTIHPLNWGTPDCWFYAPVARVLNLFDLKFGHEPVEVFENWQLVDYAAGILEKLGVDDQATRVDFYIVQPRSYHYEGTVRKWSVVASELRAMFNLLRMAAEHALEPGAKCTPNPGCLHCTARHVCDSLQRDAYRSADISLKSLPVEMPPAALGLELKMLREAYERLKGRITGLEEQVENTLRGGGMVPHHALVPSVGRLAWTIPPEQVIAMGTVMNVNLAKPLEPITPTQALNKRLLPAEVIDGFASRPSSMKLIADNGTQARKVFGK